MAKFYDFDAYVKERNKERGVCIKLFEETYYFPPTIPFDAALALQSLAGRDKDEQLSNDFVTDLFIKLVGKDIYESMRSHVDFDVDLMTSIMSWILEQYGLKADESPKEETESQQESA